jgi:hypothetical protein
LLVVLLFWLQPVVWQAASFRAPFSPFFPCLGILANIFLIASLGATAYIRFGVWLLISVAFYMFYSVHNGPSTPGACGGVINIEMTEGHRGPDGVSSSMGTLSPKSRSRVGGALAGVGMANSRTQDIREGPALGLDRS